MVNVLLSSQVSVLFQCYQMYLHCHLLFFLTQRFWLLPEMQYVDKGLIQITILGRNKQYIVAITRQ